jgi:hypothetical protein
VEITLVDAVAGLLSEVVHATNANQAEVSVGKVELNLAVELREDPSTSAGFRAWVVSPDGERSPEGSAGAQRVLIKLTPRAAGNGERLLPGDTRRPDGPGDVSGHIGR